MSENMKTLSRMYTIRQVRVKMCEKCGLNNVVEMMT
jgi:hypothetical protein